MPQESDDEEEPVELGDVVAIGYRARSLESWHTGSGHNLPPPPTYTPEQIVRINLILALQNSLLEDGTLSEEDRQIMHLNNIKLADLVPPGIYQVEFDVYVDGQKLPGEHRQWVYVMPNGDTRMITGNPVGSNLTADVGYSFEGSHPHGWSAAGPMTFYGVDGTFGSGADATTAALWAYMEATASMINNLGLNYNFLGQNSNSVFYTVGASVGFDMANVGNAPGYGVDLLLLNPATQAPVLSFYQGNLIVGDSGSQIYIGGAGVTIYDGRAGDDNITGGSSTNWLMGGDGDDVIQFTSGVAEGGSGNDTITVAGSAGAYVFGDAGNDTINGSAGRDEISAGSGDDTVYAGAGNDLVWGSAGHDILHGQDGDDRIVGGSGDDFIYGGNGNDELYGVDGSDHIEGGAGDDVIIGGGGSRDGGVFRADYFAGGEGDDQIFGAMEPDIILGGSGNDRIQGNLGGDSIWGGSGADTFLYTFTAESADPTYNPMLGRDKIFDFQSGSDKIDLTELDLLFNGPTYSDRVHWWTSGSSTYLAVDCYNDGTNDLVIELIGTTSLSWGDILM